LFGIERCDGFGSGKGYRRAVLVTDPRFAVRRRLRTVNDVDQVVPEAGEVLAEPATAFSRLRAADKIVDLLKSREHLADQAWSKWDDPEMSEERMKIEAKIFKQLQKRRPSR
jgi:hypothetical protein